MLHGDPCALHEGTVARMRARAAACVFICNLGAFWTYPGGRGGGAL